MYHGLWIIGLLALSPSFAHAGEPMPLLPRGSLRLEKTALTIGYNTAHKQADWVFYPLGPAQLRNCANRRNNFRTDDELPPETAARLADYSGSGYDRGHLSPAGDNKWSRAAMDESFLLSNISPQPADFNRGVWQRLENLIRGWAMQLNGVWVVTGPVLRGHMAQIGSGRISVPREFFKAVVMQTEKGRRALAFLLPDDAGSNLERYAMSVDALERETGLDLFAGLPGEDRVESAIDLRRWDFNADFRYEPCSKQGQDLIATFGMTPWLN